MTVLDAAKAKAKLNENEIVSLSYQKVSYYSAPTAVNMCVSGPFDAGMLALHGGIEQYLMSYFREKLVKVLHPREGQHSRDFIAEINAGRNEHPWAQHRWFQEKWPEIAEHCIARSSRYPGLLSYYQNEEKRAADVRTPIKPGKYLRKFFGDKLSEEDIQTHGLEFAEWSGPTVVHITQDADEIQSVYENGPKSCMSYDASNFHGPVHPTRVYAGPDLAIAYIGTRENASGRAVVWPDKKVFTRVYGDCHRLTTALTELGYVKGSIIGARVRRIEAGRGNFVMPYVDDVAYCRDDGEYLVLDMDGQINCRQTCGTTNPMCHCEDCGEAVDVDDEVLVYVDGVGPVCESCSYDYFFCEVIDSYVPLDETTVLGTGERVSNRALQTDGFYFCDGENEWFYEGPRYRHNFDVTESVRMANDETWSLPYFERHGAMCHWSEEYFHVDDLVTASDGEYVHPDYLDRYEAEHGDDLIEVLTLDLETDAV